MGFTHLLFFKADEALNITFIIDIVNQRKDLQIGSLANILSQRTIFPPTYGHQWTIVGVLRKSKQVISCREKKRPKVFISMRSQN